MRPPLSDKIKSKSQSTIITLSVIIVLFSFFSCRGDKKQIGDTIDQSDSISYLSTYGVSSIVTDSGRMSYKIETEEWLVYERKKPPYWAFEKGAYLEKYDDSLRIEATIESDTAYYFNEKRLWKLIGNVKILNQKGDKFYTELLYWSQDSAQFYSDKYVKIEQEDQTTTGIGFKSNQNLTKWTIPETEGIYPVKE